MKGDIANVRQVKPSEDNGNYKNYNYIISLKRVTKGNRFVYELWYVEWILVIVGPVSF